MKNLSEVLRAYRESGRMSLRDMAQEIGIDHSTYQRLEWGLNPSAETLKRVLFWLLN